MKKNTMFICYSQLQMAALSRNTASVAQDFHNAGGGKSKIEQSAEKQGTQNSNNDIFTCEKNNRNIMPINSTHDQISIKGQQISPPANEMKNTNYSIFANKNIKCIFFGIRNSCKNIAKLSRNL